MNSRVKYGISLAIAGVILVTIASIWMLLYQPNIFNFQPLGTNVFDNLTSGLWIYFYPYVSQISMQWLLIAYFGLIDSIIIYVLLLASFLGSLLTESMRLVEYY